MLPLPPPAAMTGSSSNLSPEEAQALVEQVTMDLFIESPTAQAIAWVRSTPGGGRAGGAACD